jgi:divalent metal cation (Fe/Co/Zn/Cd) transporter
MASLRGALQKSFLERNQKIIGAVGLVILLTATAFGLARPLADFLIGRWLPAEQLQQLYAILAAAPAVEEVILLQAVYTGPDEIVVAGKVRPVPSQTVDALAHAMDALDGALRAALPEVAEVYIDVTTYRADMAEQNEPPVRSRRDGN